MTDLAWVMLGMVLGGIPAVVWAITEQRHLISQIRRLSMLLTQSELQRSEEQRWQQILGASLYDHEGD